MGLGLCKRHWNTQESICPSVPSCVFLSTSCMPSILLGARDAMGSKPNAVPYLQLFMVWQETQLNEKNIQHAGCGHRVMEAEPPPFTWMGHPLFKLSGSLGPDASLPHLGPCAAFRLHPGLPTSEHGSGALHTTPQLGSGGWSGRVPALEPSCLPHVRALNFKTPKTFWYHTSLFWDSDRKLSLKSLAGILNNIKNQKW